MADHTHSADGDTDGCFGCKMAYIRASGGLASRYVGGQSFFHDSCIPERQRNKIAECRANGWEPRLKNSTYDK